MSADYVIGNAYAAPATGTLSKLTFYVGGAGAGGTQVFKGLVYADSAGSPGALVANAVTNAITVASADAAGWVDMTFATPPAVTNGATYWLSVIAGGTTLKAQRYSTGGANLVYKAATYPTYPDPFGTPDGTVVEVFSLYATYVSGSPPANTVAPAVTGTATVGQTLSCSTGTWTDDVGSHVFTYQWQRDTAGNLSFSNIGSATSSTYVLVDADDGNKVRCVVKDTDTNGNTSANSNAVGLVIEPVPTISVAPAVTGTQTVGSTLSCTTGTWANQGGSVHTYAYQWQRAGVNIGSATASTYVLVDADDATNVRCVVTATNSGGAGTPANSNAVAITEPVPTNSVAPVASGTVHVGDTVSATTGTWLHQGGTIATYAYQWQDSANGSTGWANIASATSSSYSIAVGELTKYLRCNVIATNSGGPSAAATPSNVLGPVIAASASTFVPTQSFAYGNSMYRQDVTVVTSSDPAYVAVPQLFIAAGGAKLANQSFVYRDSGSGRDRFIRKNKTHVATSDTAYIAAPNNFT